MKYVLLARPSSLIVNDMKNLITSTGCQPTPLASIDEFDNYEADQVAAVVISTALSSKVKDKYWEVIKRSLIHYPYIPIFLASYSSVKSTKIVANKRLEENGIDMELVSLDEMKVQAFDSNKQILILTQGEISNQVLFPSILDKVNSILQKTTVSLSASERK